LSIEKGKLMFAHYRLPVASYRMPVYKDCYRAFIGWLNALFPARQGGISSL
jgi:hypothetical protein